MEDKLKEECGLFGVFGNEDAARLTYLGLYALQHRGEESAGIVTTDSTNMFAHRGMGLVSDVFTSDILKKLAGHAAIGHVRYSTTGSSLLKNAQPLLVDYSRGSLAVAHNGNLVNAKLLRDELEAYGSIFQTTVDSEIILHLMARPLHARREDNLTHCLKRIKGAYSLLLLAEDEMIGIRDPNGFRPLCIGRMDGAYALASETCALDLIHAEYIRDVEPGEVVFVNASGMRSIYPFKGENIKRSYCIFEHVYFARPDSMVFGESVHLVRKKLGQHLAKEHPVEADIVIPIPDSGNSAAIGYSHYSNIPTDRGFVRNHYIGRTFIQPSQMIRDLGVKIKLNPVKDVIKDKRIVVVDDSIVRGTTSKARIKSLRDAGAKEIHMRVSCPAHKFPCFYGIDFPTRKELIASTHTLEETKKYLGVDSLGYLSSEGLLNSVSFPRDEYCVACFTGDYPVNFIDADKYSLEKGRDKGCG